MFEKVYNAASQKAGAGIQGHIFAQSVKHFVKWSKDEQAGRGHSFIERMRHSFYMATVANPFVPLSDRTSNGWPAVVRRSTWIWPTFFNGMNDITFIQGYGMTETAARCSSIGRTTTRSVRSASLGLAWGVRLGEDDEIELTGPNVFLGYYKQPELTAQTMTADGWIKTGDLGRIDDAAHLHYRTQEGHHHPPAARTSAPPDGGCHRHLPDRGSCSSSRRRQAVRVRTYRARPRNAAFLAGRSGLNADMTLPEASDNDAVRAFIQQYIDQANANVSRAESVRKFAVLDEEFSQEHGTLTPSMKVVRPGIAALRHRHRGGSVRAQAIQQAAARHCQDHRQHAGDRQEILRIGQAGVRTGQTGLEQMKTSVSDSIASVSEKIKKSKAEPEEGETGDSADNADNADNAADTGSKPDRPADEKNEE